MLFNSFDFAFFLVVSWAVYALIQRFRWPRLLWLLLISAFFYGSWHPWYLVLIVISTVNSFCFGWFIGGIDDERRRKLLLIVSVTLDLGLLGVFKYGNFFTESLEQVAALLGHPVHLGRLETELPVGISFYTFQSLSYTVDVYRRRIKRTGNLLEFAVFVFFFPQLVAGPIVRAREFLPQLVSRPRLDARAPGEGIFLILAGLAKKMIIADSLSVLVVRPFFADPSGFNSLETLASVWAANFQVYCDFSGYSDVAIGAALLFGFELPKNFDRPFQSRSPMEHWRRWHMTLSFFLRDYLYIPMGGSRQSEARTAAALIITFLLGGLWHGAGWTFVVWGLYNGLLLVAWRKWGPRRAQTWWGQGLQIFATFNAICIGLIFLHAKSFQGAWQAFGSLLQVRQGFHGLLTWPGLAALAGGVALHFTPVSWKEDLRAAFGVMPAWGVALVVVLAGGVLSLFAGMATPFFYFQF